MNLRISSHVPGRARLVLAIGFVGLLTLLVALGFYAAQALNRARTADSETTRLYLVRREALATVRSSAYAAGSRVRDYLVDPDEQSYRTHQGPARAAWQQTIEGLRQYRRTGANLSTGTVERLEQELAAYWQIAERGLKLTGAERRRTGYDLLADELGPGRDRLLTAIDELTKEDQALLRTTIAETATFLDRLHDQLWTVIGLSVLVGALLAAFTFRHWVRLEAEATERYRLSMESARQLEQLSHRLLVVQEEERKAVARELHDEVGQSVGALLVELGQAKGTLAENTAEAQQHLHTAAEMGERTLQSLRDICLVLRPSMLDDLGLIPALHWQARETSARTGMLVSVRCEDDDLELDEEHRTTVYRVVQEALRNASRHSQARKVEVALARNAGHLHIMIRDDGIGFEPSRTFGLGLLGMQERVARLAGRLRITSTPGQGATLTIDLPIAEEHHENDHSAGG